MIQNDFQSMSALSFGQSQILLFILFLIKISTCNIFEFKLLFFTSIIVSKCGICILQHWLHYDLPWICVMKWVCQLNNITCGLMNNTGIESFTFNITLFNCWLQLLLACVYMYVVPLPLVQMRYARERLPKFYLE